MISFIIPIYNEGNILRKNLIRLNTHLSNFLQYYEIICVNDGSSDNSQEILSDLKFLKSIKHKKNQGKGSAILTGINNANFDLIFFMDADLSTDINHIKEFIKIKNNNDLVIGDRSDSKKIFAKQPLYRVIIGKFCNFLFRFLFGLKIRDTQCGFKIFDKKLIKTNEFICSKYLFDLELILNFHKKNLKIYSYKVIWRNNINSKLKIFKDLPHFVYELLKLITRY